MPDEDSIFLEALPLAVERGRIRIVETLLNKLPLLKREIFNAVEIALNTLNAPRQKELIWYLAKYLAHHSSESPTEIEIEPIVTSVIEAGHSDIGLYLARRYPSLGMSKEIINLLVTMKHLFRSGAPLNFWERCIYKCIPVCLIDITHDNPEDTEMARAALALRWFKKSLWKLTTKSACIKRIEELKLMHHSTLRLASAALEQIKKHERTSSQILKFFWTSDTVLLAVKNGISELVILFLEHCPGLLQNVDFARGLIMAALTAREVEIFRLVNTSRVKGQLGNQLMNFDSSRSTIEERARGRPLYAAGAAFLLQRELQCFQIVEDMKAPLPSKDKTSFQEGFLKECQDMLKEASKWMKHTSSSCSVLAIFILTVAFAGAFTVPGGHDSNTGRPVFLKEILFIVFAIADALTLFSSVSAALMFSGILTSRYAAYDFHSSLPRKLILGLTFLFASLACVLLAIGSAFTLVLRKQFEWIHIPIALMGGFLLLLFTIQLLPLYVELVESSSR